MSDFIREILEPSEDPDYAQAFRYETDGASTIKLLWVDETPEHGVWLISNDGQKVKIPECLRKLVSKRLREATFK